MKRKIIKLLSFALVIAFSISVSTVASFASDESPIAGVFSGETMSQSFSTAEDMQKWLSDIALGTIEDTDLRGKRLVLLQDIEVSLQTIGEGMNQMASGLYVCCDVDLGGHAVTIIGNSSALLTSAIAMQSSSDVKTDRIAITNGDIICKFTSSSTMSYGIMASTTSQTYVLDGVSIISANDQTLTNGICINGKYNGAVEFKNCVVDLSVSDSTFTAFPTGGYVYTAVLESGSYKNLPTDSDDHIVVSGSKLEGLESVDENTTVITSTNTTAIIVDDGNAYLYDTLQDAVNAASRRADDSGNVEIQLLKQPEDGTVELPSDVSAEDITISKLGDDSDINLGGIIMTDSNDNKVTVGDDGKLETIIAVKSVTLDKTSLDLYVGNTAELNATVKPENAADKIVTWSSSDPTVATVDTNGNVKALKPGTTTITATAGGKSATCTVTVSYPVNIPDTYDIDLIVGEGGEAKTSLTNASAGSTITVAVTPDEGYELDYITVDGERIDGTTFTMPAHDVTVRVYFTDGSVDMPFVDVNSGDWFYDYVAYVYANGLMDGTSATMFEPNGTMTRAMVWAILARVDGETVTGANWIETARSWAMANGVSDGENANGYVTREQLATMLWRYAGEPTSSYSLSAFTDAASVSDYAETAMAWAVEHGIITGMTDTTIEPQGTATRAQCAAMLMRFVEL